MSKQRERFRRKKMRSWRSRWLWAISIFASLALIALIGLRAANPSKHDANSLDVAGYLPDTNSAFNVGTLIGQTAPTFTLPDANGVSYKFQPGDGRKYVFAFNMGFV